MTVASVSSKSGGVL